jgi:hypothetical protein
MRSEQPWDAAGNDDGNAQLGPHERGPEGDQSRPTLNTGVRRRRADRAFYLRLAGAIRQNKRALQRLQQ